MPRYFAVCKNYISKDGDTSIQLPQRSTKHAAGYDFFAAEEVTIPSCLSTLWNMLLKRPIKPTYVHTHVKAKMRANEVLFLYNRSSNPNRGLLLSNGVGVVDADYFNNESNDGDIGFGFYNILPWPVTIKVGQKIGQGVFSTYLKTDEDTATQVREGGFGSTGE